MCSSALLSCSRPVSPAALGYDVAAAVAFQRSADETLGGPVSPLSAVDGFYLQTGDRLTLGLVDGAVRDNPPSHVVSTVTVEALANAVEVRAVDGRVSLSEALTVVPLGPFQLAVGLQSGGARVVVHDPSAPARVAFESRPWFAASESYIVGARLVLEAKPMMVSVPTTRGLLKSMPRVGTLTLDLLGHKAELDAFQSAPGTLLVPFTDTSNGTQSYAVGRYVVVTLPPNAPSQGALPVVLDFNRATNPWCAYSEHYNCPIPPKDNAVAVAVLAGERAPHH